MKVGVFAIVLACLTFSCDIDEKDSRVVKTQATKIINGEGYFVGNIQVSEIDSCEYIIYSGSSGGNVIHKQNCKFCSMRNDDLEILLIE